MDDARMGTSAGDRSGLGDLLSIDADAHLQKLAACMFPTPAQLPVEMVRAALRRGAATVVVEIGRGRLRVADDGNGIAEPQWRELACALDARNAAQEREKAMGSLQSAARPGIGLLAVFVPGAESILIENASQGRNQAMAIAGGRVSQLESSSLLRGTRITISRRRVPSAAEIKLLGELCSAVEAEIILNGRAIAMKPLLRRPLARQEVDIGAGWGRVSVAVPSRGDICRVWLLDQGIPWQLITSPSFRGLVFEAALESAAMPAAEVFDMLAAAADRLYHWLAGHYLSFPEIFQERIEELVFKRMRQVGDLQLTSVFAPFRLWRSSQRLNLEEVRRLAERSVLYALPLASDPDLFLDRHQEALRLSPLQNDFLINHLGLPLVIPAAPMGTRGRLRIRLSALLKKFSRLADRWPRRSIRCLDAGETSATEKALCRELAAYWLRRQDRGPGSGAQNALEVVMAEGRGLFPAVWRQAAGVNILHIRRRHPLVILAARSVESDRANAELAFAALAPRRFLTALGR